MGAPFVLTVCAMKTIDEVIAWERDALLIIERQQKAIDELVAENIGLKKMVQEAIMRAHLALDLASK